MNGPPGKLNIAVWGLGRHAFKNVLPAIRNCCEVALIGVFSRDGTARSRASQEYRCEAFPDESSMLCDPRVTAVYLATPIGLHFEHGRRVLEQGRHLLCEKSLTDDYQKSSELIAAARSGGLVLCETFMYRFHPRFAALLNLVSSAAFGRVVSVTCSFYVPTLEHPGYRYNSLLGGGAFLDVGCYLISLVRAISEPVSVDFARLSTATGFNVDTGGVAFLRLPNDGHAHLDWGYGAAYKNEVTILGGSQSVYADYVFSKGGANCSELLLRDCNGRQQRLPVVSTDGFVEMLVYVAKAIGNQQMRDGLLSEAAGQARWMNEIRKHALGA
jgi:predicted dehydrogenase